MIRSVLAKPFASFIAQRQQKWMSHPEETQLRVLKMLLKRAAKTKFGTDHYFNSLRTPQDFAGAVPMRDYEQLRPYVDLAVQGWQDVLWPGRPAYFAKTSGTTSGVKYIPLSKDSVPYHINGARDALMCYIHETGKADFLDKKLIFLSGSPELEHKNEIPTGRLSGIVNHHVPAWLRSNQMPSYETNCIEDWEYKLEMIVDETLKQPMSLISGIPPWVQMYFDRITTRTGKSVGEVFPHFSVFVYGGVNFEPYRTRIMDSIGRKVDTIETYPASEGFIAYQDSLDAEGLLLLLNHGIYYEFIPADEFFKPNLTRLHIGEVKTGVNYALLMSTNAGLWAYAIGDTVKFVSTNPHRLIVTGRISHFISAFGEHVIAEEVEKALKYAMQKHPETEVKEFTVAPQVNPAHGLPHHEWLIAFARPPANREAFAADIDQKMRELNVYYDDLIRGNILCPLQITTLEPEAFIGYMKAKGKLGGQNKVPRLANDRTIANELRRFML